MKKLPNINLEEMEKIKEEILKERIEFKARYAKWLESRKEKSGEQKEIIG